MSKRGLPAERRMRHDAHYIDEIIGHRADGVSIGRLIPIDKIEPNPQQPRTDIGDLTELTMSIADRGVLEPLLVQPRENQKWLIIAGERRWRAATAAGLEQVPCIELKVDDRTVAEIALIENLQRKDLTAWEEAEGLLALCHRFGYTHEEVARKVGKSRSSVTESLNIANLPAEVKAKCQQAGIKTKSTLLQIVRQPTDDEMHKMIETVGRQGLTREQARAVRRTMNGETNANTIHKFYKYQVAPGIKVQIEANRELDEQNLLEVLQHAAQQITRQVTSLTVSEANLANNQTQSKHSPGEHVRHANGE